ncbi:site-specific integrase [Archaeoglobales archaeon]|nr:MAG: site-specific integrase [Archaeoglobales archaeon]
MNLKVVVILKKGVRILTPNEYEKLRDGAKKQHHQIMLDMALFSGMRYVELKRFQEHPEWLNKQRKTIYLPPDAQQKKKRKFKDRYVYLSNMGMYAVQLFLSLKEKLPSIQAWDENLKRWAEKSGLDPTGISAKTTRKTWESWLVVSYPDKIPLICMNQGHSELTAMAHYQQLPFTREEKEEIKVRTSGWMGL